VFSRRWLIVQASAVMFRPSGFMFRPPGFMFRSSGFMLRPPGALALDGLRFAPSPWKTSLTPSSISLPWMASSPSSTVKIATKPRTTPSPTPRAVPCYRWPPRLRSMVDALSRQYAGFVQSKLARREIGPAFARDLHPQVFVTLGQQVQKHGLLDPPEAMLLAITEHKIRNDLRQKKRRPTFARAAAGRIFVEESARWQKQRPSAPPSAPHSPARVAGPLASCLS